MKVLDSKGFSHGLVLGIVVVIVGVIGTFWLVKGHAEAPTNSIDPAALNQTDSVTDDPAQAINTAASCAQYAQTPVVGQYNTTYWLNPDRYGGGTMCPQNTGGKADYTIVGSSQNGNGGVLAFPDLIYGCDSTSCISGEGLPKKVSSLNNPRASASWQTKAGGEWDAIYDLWFNQTDSHGASRGAELLVMENEQDKPFPKGIAKEEVSVAGISYWMLHYTQHSGSRSWNFIEFRRVNSTDTNTKMSFIPFIQKAEGAKQVSSSWYLTGIDTGNEIWKDGIGLGVSDLVIAGI